MSRPFGRLFLWLFEMELSRCSVVKGRDVELELLSKAHGGRAGLGGAGLRNLLGRINLSPLRYGRIMEADGGPIRKLEMGALDTPSGRLMVANAYLKASLVPVGEANVGYGDADGSGSDPSSMIARFKAISEALERWAFRATFHGGDRGRYGMELDPTSNGMSAFPGLVSWGARRTAELEALERYVLFSWWEGRCGAVRGPEDWEGAQVLDLVHGLGDFHVVLLFREGREAGTRVYGHGAGQTLAAACRSAHGELLAHENAMQHLAEAYPDPDEGMGQLTNPFERRALWFYLPEGQAQFDEQVRGSARRKGILTAPGIVFNGPLEGPWSRYAHVWRTTIRPISEHYLDSSINYFFW